MATSNFVSRRVNDEQRAIYSGTHTQYFTFSRELLRRMWRFQNRKRRRANYQ
jgi:hypothetical protein